MTNIDYFRFSAANPEPLLDSSYSKSKIVIPPTISESNTLTVKNTRLIELISAFHVLHLKGCKLGDSHFDAVLNDIISILDSTEHINLSAFSQFCHVYSCSYDDCRELGKQQKMKHVSELLTHFCEERHSMYLSHGYSNIVLQVVSDSYSHKRHSISTINKIENILISFGFSRMTEASFPSNAKQYFLPDKGKIDKSIFDSFLTKFGVEFKYAESEQGKLPDMVLGIRDDWFVIEMKNIKGSGGGQDKQLTEVINFIKYSETNTHIHYLVFLDGECANRLFPQLMRKAKQSKSNKIQRQIDDISSFLTRNPGNFFVNTAGFKRLLADTCKHF